MPKYVITGGPCTGKTTLVRALKKEGFVTIPEAAGKVINKQRLLFGKKLPWKDREGFQEEVLKLQLKLEKRATKATEVFIDRGIPDGIVYYQLDNFEPPKELTEIAKTNRYDKVFVLEWLGFQEITAQRKEDPETAKKIGKLIKEIYEELGYNVIEVPSASVKERVAFVKSKL